MFPVSSFDSSHACCNVLQLQVNGTTVAIISLNSSPIWLHLLDTMYVFSICFLLFCRLNVHLNKQDTVTVVFFLWFFRTDVFLKDLVQAWTQPFVPHLPYPGWSCNSYMQPIWSCESPTKIRSQTVAGNFLETNIAPQIGRQYDSCFVDFKVLTIYFVLFVYARL